MEQSVHTAINWLSESKMVELIKNAGFQAHGDNEDEVRENFRELVMSGDISADSFMD